MTYTDYLWFNTKARQEFIRITDKVADIVDKSGVTEGMVLVSAMDIPAGVYVNDWEEGLIHDFQVWLEKLAPSGLDYRHHQTGEDNADAHLKRTIMGHQVIVPITRGKLDLGPWEQIFYAEFDGQRRKRVIVKVMGSSKFEVRSSWFEVRGSKFVVRSSTVLDPTDEAPQSLSLESARRISNPELRTWNRSNLEPLTQSDLAQSNFEPRTVEPGTRRTSNRSQRKRRLGVEVRRREAARRELPQSRGGNHRRVVSREMWAG